MSRGGAKPKIRGNWSEEILTPIFRSCPGSSIDKTEAPFKIVGYTWQVGRKVAYGYPMSSGLCDYEGGYFGRHCCIEAKRHDGKNSRWKFKSAIAQHQQDRLRRSIYFREVSAVILCWDNPADSGSEPAHWFWVPYDFIMAAQESGLKSWRLEDVQALITPTSRVMHLRHFNLKIDVPAALSRELEALEYGGR